MATIEERVKRGAEWLDTIKPYWYDEVMMCERPLDARAMETCSDCVAGRIFDSYGKLELPEADGGTDNFDQHASQYGFTIDWETHHFTYDKDDYEGRKNAIATEFMALAKAWNTEIQLRVQKEAADDDPRRT